MTPAIAGTTLSDDLPGRRGTRHRPPAWAVLEQGLLQRRPVAASYHDQPRLLCPHALGWKNGRAKVLAYQADGTTSTGGLPADPAQRWRSMFIDEIDNPAITDDPWQTADNYTSATNGIDQLDIDINNHSSSHHL